MIDVQHVRKVFQTPDGEVVALNDISLSIPTGAMVALMGPSGSGKTTLLNIIGAMDAPTSGTVTLDAVRVEPDENGAAPDWKHAAQSLQQFQTQWHKLGPLEHTLPHKSVATMDQRLKASVTRIQNVLQSVHGTAKAEREQLIVRAKALRQHAASRDLMTRLRELQTQWQRHARALPLPHKLENALWDEFKSATDAVMNERDAALSARKAEFAANHAAREGLIARLATLTEDSPSADIRRILSAVDSEWRSAGEMAKDQAAPLTARFHAARDRVQELLANSARRIWSRHCDALLAKLALCDERETNPAGEAGALPWRCRCERCATAERYENAAV